MKQYMTDILVNQLPYDYNYGGPRWYSVW